MKRSLTAACALAVSASSSGMLPGAVAFSPMTQEPSQSKCKGGHCKKNGGGSETSSASARFPTSSPNRRSFPTSSLATRAVTSLSVASSSTSSDNNNESTTSDFSLRLKRQEILHSIPEDEERDVGDLDQQASVHQRRLFLNAMLTGAAAGFATGTGTAVEPASAYEQAYPVDLDFQGRDLASVRSERIASQKAAAKKSRDDLTSNPLAMREPKDFLGSFVWAGALWLLAGSRSNPLVTPVANVLYDEKETQWLKDRNEGLFAPLPAALLALMGLIFLALGVVADRSILLLADGDKDICLQLAGVSLISGASLELGRIASGEKDATRAEDDRDSMLQREFAEFAERRLIPGGRGANVHRSEIAAAFRRFNAKYRVENDEYPLTDLEIERLARAWNRMQGNDDMSSAGFFTGMKINNQADAFR